jgi:AcrR family transcriptional regulator
MTAQPAVREEPPHGAVGHGAVGHAVRLSRLAAGMSLRELARRIKVSAATVHAIETGKTDLAVSRLRDIATVLHTTPERLLTTDASIDVEPAAPRRRPTVAPPVGIEDWRMFGPLRIDPVLAAAITVFVRTGYHGATMRSIARRAGMSVPGVYHHYRGKQMLLVTTLDLSMDDLTWRVLAAGAEGRDGISRVRLMVEALALFHTHRWELAFIGASEMRSLEPADRRRIADLRNHVQHLLDEAIDQAIAEGSLGTPSPRHAGRAIATMCTSLPQWFHLGGPTSPEQIAAEYARFALGLLAHPLAAPA